MLRRSFTALAMLGLALASASPSGAQEAGWPNRAIRVIVPFGAGGTTDLTARLLAPEMGRRLGQPWVVENRAGAGGNVGSDACAKAAPDGYTLCIGTISSHAINAAVYPRMPYDNLRDFAPIALISLQPNALFVPASSPANNVADLIALMRAQPGAFNYASSGVGTSIHLAGALFTQATGTTAEHVPYRSSGQLMTELMAGNVQMAFDNISSGLPHVRDGRMKLLGVASPERVDIAPEAPTIAETLPGFESLTWGALFAPAGTPAAVIARLNRETNAALTSPEVAARFAQLGITTRAQTPEDVGAFVAAETRRWGEVAQRAGIRAE
ncbi:tripartite-type tricarboxylate transporter receptor subunit TctC [Humitalea rosea]|uniref:Tripartite-type tricarboxylate transporter receptor subunit TctC n=1 Tax=Humitalea rosea TaxID=990373 RepID=A0A2W7IG38_9PROT|nr:tripartite tricarboxylate transporter substrate binding protein [Humitalea rosea]PZW37733.1 tripartite-type tricarboxylate transporter receptor subunit TctC [Humitalea rosea]